MSVSAEDKTGWERVFAENKAERARRSALEEAEAAKREAEEATRAALAAAEDNSEWHAEWKAQHQKATEQKAAEDRAFAEEQVAAWRGYDAAEDARKEAVASASWDALSAEDKMRWEQVALDTKAAKAELAEQEEARKFKAVMAKEAAAEAKAAAEEAEREVEVAKAAVLVELEEEKAAATAAVAAAEKTARYYAAVEADERYYAGRTHEQVVADEERREAAAKEESERYHAPVPVLSLEAMHEVYTKANSEFEDVYARAKYGASTWQEVDHAYKKMEQAAIILAKYDIHTEEMSSSVLEDDDEDVEKLEQHFLANSAKKQLSLLETAKLRIKTANSVLKLYDDHPPVYMDIIYEKTLHEQQVLLENAKKKVNIWKANAEKTLAELESQFAVTKTEWECPSCTAVWRTG